MAKKLFIAEKPSVAQEFAKALKYQMSRRDGYLESEEAINCPERILRNVDLPAPFAPMRP